VTESFTVLGVPGIPDINAGDDLAGLICDATAAVGVEPNDVVVVAQKVVSKAEGAIASLSEITPSEEAKRVASTTGQPPELVEVILSQSSRIVRMQRGVLITETVHGFVCANAGIDASNVEGDGVVTLLPNDADVSATGIRQSLETRFGAPIRVVVSDSFNRPWRMGSVNVAIGVSGFYPLGDHQGQADDHGVPLKSTLVSVADEVASAAQLVMGEFGRVPVAIVRGLVLPDQNGDGQMLLRDAEHDLFR
jgi:coenzyme F420-0:L-glutamate ligase/coenzyme F420-1:gamma-L-glutamate ligase